MNRASVPSFTVEAVLDGSPVLIRVSGEFDLTSVDHFEIATAPVPTSVSIVIDLSATSLIDSAALGAILRLRRDQTVGGGTVLVRAPRPYQRQLFEVTGLLHLLEPAV